MKKFPVACVEMCCCHGDFAECECYRHFLKIFSSIFVGSGSGMSCDQLFSYNQFSQHYAHCRWSFKWKRTLRSVYCASCQAGFAGCLCMHACVRVRERVCVCHAVSGLSAHMRCGAGKALWDFACILSLTNPSNRHHPHWEAFPASQVVAFVTVFLLQHYDSSKDRC